MDFGWIGPACDAIILIGALFVAFDRIIKPIIFIKKKTNNSFEVKVAEALTKAMPDILQKHYEDIKDQLIKEVSEKVETSINDELTQVELLKQQYDILVLTAKDVLREKIMKIYNDYHRERVLPIDKKEQLDQYYNDYKKLKGNSYIDRYYRRMERWLVLEDNEEQDPEESQQQ